MDTQSIIGYFSTKTPHSSPAWIEYTRGSTLTASRYAATIARVSGELSFGSHAGYLPNETPETGKLGFPRGDPHAAEVGQAAQAAVRPVQLRRNRRPHRHHEADLPRGTLRDGAGQGGLHVGLHRGGIALDAEGTHVEEVEQPARRIAIDGRFIDRFAEGFRLDFQLRRGFCALKLPPEGVEPAGNLGLDLLRFVRINRDFDDALPRDCVIRGSALDGHHADRGINRGEQAAHHVQRIRAARVDVAARVSPAEIVEGDSQNRGFGVGGAGDGERAVDGETPGAADAEGVFLLGVDVDEVGGAEEAGLELERAEHAGLFVARDEDF